MADVATDGMKVVFEPSPDWSWQGWNGESSLSAVDRGFVVGDAPVAIDADLLALISALAGKSYVTPTFTIPGSVLQATIIVNPATLARATTVRGTPVAVVDTQGQFQISCTPAQQPGSPPVPDPLITRMGRWFIRAGGGIDAATA